MTNPSLRTHCVITRRTQIVPPRGFVSSGVPRQEDHTCYLVTRLGVLCSKALASRSPNSYLLKSQLSSSQSPAQAVVAKALNVMSVEHVYRHIPSSTSQSVSVVILQSPPSCRCLPCCTLSLPFLCAIHAGVNHHVLRVQQRRSPLTAAHNSDSASLSTMKRSCMNPHNPRSR